MKLEDQVCSLELAMRLKELGIDKESYFTWCQIEGGEYYVYPFEIPDESTDEISAYSVAELGALLIDIGFTIPPSFKEDKTEADVRAELLIDLLEHMSKNENN